MSRFSPFAKDFFPDAPRPALRLVWRAPTLAFAALFALVIGIVCVLVFTHHTAPLDAAILACAAAIAGTLALRDLAGAGLSPISTGLRPALAAGLAALLVQLAPPLWTWINGPLPSAGQLALSLQALAPGMLQLAGMAAALAGAAAFALSAAACRWTRLSKV